MPPAPLDVARAAAEKGGEVIQKYLRQGVQMRSKATCDLVSDADLESEQVIVEAIRRSFPDHAIIGEESHTGDTMADQAWIVDPLDGTNNFAHDIPHFAVSIAYYEKGQPQCGVIYNPVRNDWYWSQRGEGAYCNDQRVEVSKEAQLQDALIGVGFYYDRGAMMESTLAAIRELFQQSIHGIRRFGTASLDLCHVGMGFYGAYFEYELSAWDFAAGQLFVQEAGGRVTTCQGKHLPLRKTSVLASNGLLHESVLKIVSSHYDS